MRPNRLFVIIAVCAMIAAISCNQAATTSTPAAKNTDSIKTALVKSFYPLLEKGDWAGIEKITSADFTDHNAWVRASGVSGRDSLLTGLKGFKDGFPDMKFDILHTAVDGDMVFIHYRFTGSNNGPLMGMPATNKKVDYMGVDLLKVSDSTITAHWDYGDNVTYMKQMGLMP